MDSFRGQGGIQMLLTAEQEAQHIITCARNLKMARLKRAQQEAKREVAQYRSHMEAEFQKKIFKTSGDTMKRFEQETEAKIQNMKASTSKVSNNVIGMLVKYVTTVKI